MISICESNLCSSIFDSELFDTDEFLVYRCDRSELNSKCSSWGGVLIAVRSNLSSERIIVPGTEEVEAVFVKLNLSDRKVFVACVYVPSGSVVERYKIYAHAFSKFLDFIKCGVNDSVFVLGDFNMANVRWTPDPEHENILLPGTIHSSGDSDLIHTLLSADLSQINFVKNEQGNLLDLVFSTDPDNVLLRKSNAPLSKIDKSYHEAIEFTYDVSDYKEIEPNNEAMFYDVKNSDFDGLRAFFSQLVWDDVFSGSETVDDAVNAFYDKLSMGMEQYVPLQFSSAVVY